MAAGACSRALTTPIANIVTRKQTATLVDSAADSSTGGEGGKESGGVRNIIRSIRREKGLAGFWSGYSASLVLTLNPSLTFFLQDFLKHTFASEHYDDPGPRRTFLFAAASKAISSFITYPFSIAKTRLQSGIPLSSDQDDAEAKSEEAHNEKTTTRSSPPEKKKSGGEEDRDVDKEVEDKLNAVRAVQRLARRSIFGTLAEIVRTEGVGSLYDGVQGELLKGFFSHGTTMLAKDVVHKLLFRLYFVVVGVVAELRRRRAARGASSDSLPRALRYRIDGQTAGNKSARGTLDYGLKVLANLVDGSQRPVKGD